MPTLESVSTITKPPQKPFNTPWGYVITADGTTYALNKQWYHGVVIGLLYPDLAKEQGFEFEPDWIEEGGKKYPNEPNVFHWQKFELDNHRKLPLIRVCPTRCMSPCSIDKGSLKPTKEQVEALRLCLQVIGLRARDKIETDLREMKVSDIWKYLEEDTDEYYT